ncbi:putative 39S ribosomal protein L48, mitochondrial [Apostichopus japonicus]|uniref:Putative 39S ribosomal protein L48, mitochondrial n=1 Tax=Stichopus japonicus TaxID=307972 RepID=A0A2G8KW92_STIJA|nr:putative 39S ribosomal protein L48, mitochondrial [Apostichopus japonicus]
MSWRKIGQFQATRCYADNFDEEVEELRVQQIADQEIPPPADDTVHEVLNIKAFGYDCTLVEHFAQYTHNLSKNMSLSVFDSYALPAKATLVHAIQGTGLKEKDRIKDYTLTTYQRVIQIQDLPSKRASLLLDLLQLNLPEGVSFTITPHTQEHYKERFIRKEIPDSLL